MRELARRLGGVASSLPVAHFAKALQTLGLGMGDDLDHLATDIPTADDLLDSADDAPAIRLINGIIADAARQGVSVAS